MATRAALEDGLSAVRAMVDLRVRPDQASDGDSDDESGLGAISNQNRSPHDVPDRGSSGRLGKPSVLGKQGSFDASSSSNALLRQNSAQGKYKFNNKGMNRKDFKKKQQHRFFKDYKFPSGINENAMDFLNEDMELILAYTDAKAKEKQSATVEEELKGQALRSKTRKKVH